MLGILVLLGMLMIYEWVNKLIDIRRSEINGK